MDNTLKSSWGQRPIDLPCLGVTFVAWAAALVAVGFGFRVLYNIFLHPLRKFPGPLACHSSELWRMYKIWSGDMPQTVKLLHDKYGPVVRIAPNELSFIDSQAWKDIYGHHGSYEMPKDPNFYRLQGKYQPDTIISADREHHSMLRRQLAHGFSERSMQAQEPIIREYVDLLICRLEEHCKDGRAPLEMTAWFNFTTFDIIGDLAFGNAFNCLEKSQYHPWIKAISHNLKNNALMRIIVRLVPPYVNYVLVQTGVLKGRKDFVNYSKDMIRKRQALETRPDLIEGLLKRKDVLTQAELVLNASVLILAGSETTATLLSGATFLLGSNRDALAKLSHEVRSSFNSEDEITLISVNKLDYMLACLNESLRLYPPVAIGLPRLVPTGGHEIAGYWVPEDTSVSVWQWAAYRSQTNFSKPEEFHPERFLGDKGFSKDDLAAMQPFSVGPRNCIGRNLAYAEMRLILARILYKFDIELAPGAGGWIKSQRVHMLWNKPNLPVYLKPVKSSS